MLIILSRDQCNRSKLKINSKLTEQWDIEKRKLSENEKK